MKLTLIQEKQINLIRSYENGQIRIGDEYFACPLMLSATKRWNWTERNAERLGIEHFSEQLTEEPEIILLGCGPQRRQPSAALIAALASRGIGLESMDNGAACRTYNVLVAEDRQVLLALQV